MGFRARIDGVYTRAERISDAAVHVTGIVVALVATPMLVVFAILWRGEPGVVAAVGVYGVSLLMMLCCSALYHMAPLPGWKDRLRRLDQSAIYLKIAGTYTPFAVLAGSQAMPFLAGLWAAAAAGVSLKLLSSRQLFGLTVALYLAMGWAAAVLGGPILSHMTPTGFSLVLTAGCLYTIGVVFLIWERLPHHVAVWHGFVLSASLLLYAAVLLEISGPAAG